MGKVEDHYYPAQSPDLVNEQECCKSLKNYMPKLTNVVMEILPKRVHFDIAGNLVTSTYRCGGVHGEWNVDALRVPYL